MNTTYNAHEKARGFTKALIRPAWTPATIAMMIVGFMIFWPLGLAMIAYILWGDRLESFKSEVNDVTDRMSSTMSGFGKSTSARTGNVAFDDWRDAEIERIEEERRKLEETRREFDAHLRELRRAKDQSEFEDFMASYKKQTGGKSSSDKTSKSEKGKKGKAVPRMK